MAFRDNLAQLAEKLGIPCDPSLREIDIVVGAINFTDGAGKTNTIVATETNLGSRLFFQVLADQYGAEIKLCQEVRDRAIDYFSEHWEADPIPGMHPLLDAIRNSVSAKVIWKKDIPRSSRK